MNLERILYGNSLQQWLVAAAIMVSAALAIWIVERFAVAKLARFARSTRTGIDDLIAAVLGRTSFWLALVVAVFAASLALTLEPSVALILRRAAAVAVVLQVGVWANAAISFWVDRFTDRELGQDAEAVTTVSALSFVGRLGVWVVVLLLILDNLGVEVTALLTGLGIGGIAVALAVQKTLGDLFASLSIVLDKPFVIGDFLVVGQEKGTVEHVGLKTTRLRSVNGEQLVLGNNDLLNSRIHNFGRMGDRRASFRLGVVYGTPRAALAAIPAWVREIIEAQPDTRHDRSHLIGLGPYSIDFEHVYYLTVPDYATYMDTQQAIHLAILEKFEREGVEFAYPTQVVYTVSAVGGESRPDATPR